MTQSTETRKETAGRKQFQILLVSAPWSLFHRPSIQVATLRSYLEMEGGYTVRNRHLYLDVAKKIGVDLYSRIARSSWAGEALFAPLLFPEKKDDAARLFNAELSKDGKRKVVDFNDLVEDIRQALGSWLSKVEADRFDLIGFSVCFSQLLPSLYLAAQFKKITEAPIVFGGTSCSGEVGEYLVEQFNQIDYLVDGEGEGPLLELCNTLLAGKEALPERIRTKKRFQNSSKKCGIKHLDQLPVPGFEPYLKEVRQLFPEMPFMPILPMEFSRGCSWNRCTFCNLNLQWKGYRHKSARRMIAEVTALSVQNESLNFNFTDNVLPARETDEFFRAMAASRHDYHFFAEIRAKTAPDKLALFRQGGLRSVQVGIESLSGSLLSRMGKGTTVIDNIAIMKYCSELGIDLMGNIIIEFPGTSPEEIEETLTNIEFVLPFTPLDPASFFLGLGSPIYNRPRDYGISAITPHPKGSKLLPQQHHKGLLVAGYRGDRVIQERRWKAVRSKLIEWHTFHKNRKGAPNPPLHYRDGGSFLTIYQELPDHSTLLHRLRGVSRALYLYCAEPKHAEDIDTTFPKLSSGAIAGFIDQLCKKRLMFQDSGKALALAIRSTS